MCAFLEDIARPILWVLGTQGSGKTTRSKIILNLVDPVEHLGATAGKSERDDSVNAGARYVPSWDNVGHISPATSDWMCRLVTGATDNRRTLYTQEDSYVRTIQRLSAIATSITLPNGLGPDALERLVLVEFERIPGAREKTEDDGPRVRRQGEKTLMQRYHEARPRILGALLDDLAGVLRHVERFREADRRGELASLPRMADYGVALMALDEQMGGQHARTYAESVEGILSDRAMADPLTMALLWVVKGHDCYWKGPAEKLLKLLDMFRPDDPKARWPHDARGLGTALRVQAETLHSAGLTVNKDRDHGGRFIELTLDRSKAAEIDDPDPKPTFLLRKPARTESEKLAS